MRHFEFGSQGFWLGGHEPVESALIPVNETFGRFCLHYLASFARVVAGASQGTVVLAHVLRSLGHDAARRVEPGSSRPPRHLVELTGREEPARRPVVLRQPGEKNGPYWHIYPDAEGVGAAYDLQQAFLAKPLDQPSVFRQHPGVMDANAVPQEPAQRLAEARPQPRLRHGHSNGIAFGPGGQLGAG